MPHKCPNTPTPSEVCDDDVNHVKIAHNSFNPPSIHARAIMTLHIGLRKFVVVAMSSTAVNVRWERVIDLVTGPPRLGDDLGHLVHLSLGAAEGTEPLLRQLARTLVLAVPEQFDDAALVGGQAGDFADDLADERGAVAG